MNESQLLKLKAKVDLAKTDVAELKGHQSALLKQLKEEWGCPNTEAAEKKLKTMKDEHTKLEEKIESGLAELEEKYDV